MDKSEYIRTRLSKLTHKSWELFVISRIIHRLDDLSIEFVCQQMVRRENGKHALSDLYFPQFGLHLEVDEKHHDHEVNQQADFLREKDIVAATQDDVHRIRISERGRDRPLEHILGDIERFIELVHEKKRAALAAGTFRPWDPARRFNPWTWIDQGSISVEENVSFTTQVDALRCFGFTGRTLWKGAWNVKDGSGRRVWFPRLTKQDVWDNRLTETAHGATITVERFDGVPDPATPGVDMIVFARATDSYGATLFRFKGVFVYKDELSTPTRSVYERKATRTTTVAPKMDRPYDVHEKFAGAGIIGGAQAQAFIDRIKNGEMTLRR